MVTLEQIKLLESRVSRAIDIVNRVTEENSLLKGKLENYQKRIDELEVLIQRFKEDQGRIEEGILSALDRLGRFEDALEHTVKRPAAAPPDGDAAAPQASPSVAAAVVPAGTAPPAAPSAQASPAAVPSPAPSVSTTPVPEKPPVPAEETVTAPYIPAEEDGDDTLIFDDDTEEGEGAAGDGAAVDSAELDIF